MRVTNHGELVEVGVQQALDDPLRKCTTHRLLPSGGFRPMVSTNGRCCRRYFHRLNDELSGVQLEYGRHGSFGVLI